MKECKDPYQPIIGIKCQFLTVTASRECSPSSKFSLAQFDTFLTVTERNAAELSLELPRYLDELFVPFPAIEAAFDPALAPASAESLVLRRGPESENNLPDI